MLEKFCGATTARRLKGGVFGPYLETFCSEHERRGYRPASIKTKLWIVSQFGTWVVRHEIGLRELGDAHADGFVQALIQRGRRCSGALRTVTELLRQLRAAGVVAQPAPVVQTSPSPAILEDYRNYLETERALAQSTIKAYLRWVKAFTLKHLKPGAGGLWMLDAGDIVKRQNNGTTLAPRSRDHLPGSERLDQDVPARRRYGLVALWP